MSDPDPDDDAPDVTPRLTAEQKRQGRRLLRVWGAVAVVYVLVAAICSIAPIRDALADAPRQAASADAEFPWAREPAGTILRQVGVTVAPPLLVLWLGWDVWFAVAGFLGRRRSLSKPQTR